MIEFVIKKDDSDQRIDKFSQKVTQNCTVSMINKWIRTKKIKVNRKRCENNQRIFENDIVQFFIPHDFIKQKQADFLNTTTPIQIEYEDDNVLVVWKNKGILLHKTHQNQQDTLTQQVLNYLHTTNQYDYQSANSFTPASIHRLDRNTEGYVIFAKHYGALKDLNRLMKENKIHKKYITIVENKIAKQGILQHYHYKDKHGKVFVSNEYKDGYKIMKTKYKVLETFNHFNLLEVELISGKSHQIRAQFSHIGNPVYGDQRYGSKYQSDYQALSAYMLQFTYQKLISLKKTQNTTILLFNKLKNKNK